MAGVLKQDCETVTLNSVEKIRDVRRGMCKYNGTRLNLL